MQGGISGDNNKKMLYLSRVRKMQFKYIGQFMRNGSLENLALTNANLRQEKQKKLVNNLSDALLQLLSSKRIRNIFLSIKKERKPISERHQRLHLEEAQHPEEDIIRRVRICSWC